MLVRWWLNPLLELERNLKLIYQKKKTFISAWSYHAPGKLLGKKVRIVRGLAQVKFGVRTSTFPIQAKFRNSFASDVIRSNVNVYVKMDLA